jgi:hypothetical protein
MIGLSPSEALRAGALMRGAVHDLELSLSGLTVLTEVGSRHFQLTPLLAVMANAKRVYAWARDSSYGDCETLIRECEVLADKVCVDRRRIVFAANERPRMHIQEADIITNLGAVRPINADFLMNAKRGNAAIPLMYEAWEFRGEDVDLETARRQGIRVAGTFENHPSIRVFDYCGPLAMKMAFEGGYEVLGNNIIVWSDDPFGDVIERAFLAGGAAKVLKTVDPRVALENIASTDFMYFCDYSEQREIVGEDGLFTPSSLAERNPSLGIIHLFGHVNPELVKRHNLSVYPDRKGYASKMSFTLAHSGLTPIVRFLTAGLKVGEALRNGIANPLCQPFV